MDLHRRDRARDRGSRLQATHPQPPGLPVIWTCRADDYEGAHFDTRQYNHIVWRTAKELRERLFTRIKVVVG
jgi:hypothetical protein